MTAVPHSSVTELVSRYLRAVDEAAPGLVEALYLTGSTVLDDYRPGRSDIDVLVGTAHPPGAADLRALAEVHAGMPTTPHFDGVYLTRGELEQTPDDERIVPHVVNGEFHPDQPCGELNPVLWLTILRFGVRVRGTETDKLGIRVDPHRLRQWCLGNLMEYWQPLADHIRRAVADRPDDAVATAETVAWTALGPARLHYTMASEDIISKSAAGTYAAERFPIHAKLLDRARRWRLGDDVPFVIGDARAAAALVDAVVDDARRRWA